MATVDLGRAWTLERRLEAQMLTRLERSSPEIQ